MSDRVLYKDIVPYDTPSSLAALSGPAAGILTLPVTVHWGPRTQFDLDDARDVQAAYRAVIREGTSKLQEQLLNRDVLHKVWRELALPDRCRHIWEDQFPELAP